jgi:hypothetical protein
MTHDQDPANAPQRNKRDIWIASLFFAVLLLFILAGVAYRTTQANKEKLTEVSLEQSFINEEYGISLRLPESWDYGDAAPNYHTFVMRFASSEESLRETPDVPSNGAGIVIFNGSQTAGELFPGISDVELMLTMTIADQWSRYAVIEEPASFNAGEYPAARSAYLVAQPDRGVFFYNGERKFMTYFGIVIRDEEVIRLVAVCDPQDWLEYRPVFEAIFDSLVVTPRTD